MKHFTPTPGTRNARAFLASLLAYLLLVGQVAPVALANAPATRAATAAAASGAGAGEAPRLNAAPEPAPLPAPLAVGVTATKADSWDDTATPDGKAEPGQEIGYEVTVSNGGPDTASLTFSDTIDPNTTFVTGSLTMSPLARNDAYTSSPEAALNVNAASGVLANDSGLPAPEAAGVVGCADASAPFECATAKGGTVSLAADGSFTYTPPNDPTSFTGADSFSYTATNSNSPDDTASVTIAFNPSAVNDSTTVNEDSGATTVDVLANDVDPDGGANAIQSVTQPANGTVAITNAGADLTYTPNADYCNTDTGVPDTFTYTLNGGDTATVSVNVTCVDDNPTAVNDSATVNEDSGANTVDVLANDTDPDGGSKSIASVTQPANGTVAITNAGADLTYTPNADYCNNPPGTTPDTFTYTLTQGGSSATVSVTVTCVEDNPTAVNDSATVPEDSGATPVDVLANDTDPDGGSKSIASVTQPANGTVAITNAGADLTYTPNANYCNSQVGGTPDTFTYTLSPGGSSATVSVTVTCEDDAPTAVNDSATVAEDSGATAVDVLANDTDPDGGTKSIASVTQPANGTVVITGGGTGLTYQPNANYNGADTFTYTLNGGSIGTVNVTVTEVNDAPTAANDTLSDVLEDSGTRTIAFTALTGNDSAGPANENTQTLTVTGVSAPVGGSVVINGTNVEFTPTADFCGAASFTYTVTDNGTTAGSADAKSANATASFTVTCVNDPPSFTKGADVTVNEDAGAQTVNPWATAISPGPGESGQILTFNVSNDNNGLFTALGQPAVNSTTGALTFTPAPNAFGVANVTISLSDNGGGADTSAAQTFVITVTPVNDAPVANTDTFDTIGNTELRVDLDPLATRPNVSETTAGGKGALENDSDPVEGHTFQVSGIVGCSDTTAPFDCTVSNQHIVMESDGSFSYVPAPGTTSGTFQYTITDNPPAGEGTAASATGTVNINITDMVWYVDANASAVGANGTSEKPYTDFVPLNGAAGAGDSDAAGHYIFVHDGTYAIVNGLELEADQRLYGEGFGLSLNRNLNGNGAPTVLVAPGTYPTVASGVDTIKGTAALPSEIRGLSLSSTAANAIDLTAGGAYSGAATGLLISGNIFTGAIQETVDINSGATGTRTITVENNTWSGIHGGNAVDIRTSVSGSNLVVDVSGNQIVSNANGIVIDGSTAGSSVRIQDFAGNTFSGNIGGTAVSVNTATFDSDGVTVGIQSVSGGNTAVGQSGNGVGGGGIVLSNVQGNLAFNDLDIVADGGAGLFASGTGGGLTLSTTAGTSNIAASGGPAVDINNAAVTLPLEQISSTNSASTGVSLVNVTGTFSANSASSITNAAGTDFNVSGGTVAVTYNGTITDDVGQLVNIANTTGGTKAFTGAITDGDDGDGSGVSITNNTGATVSFRGGLVLSTGTNPAFTATGGGTIEVCNENPCNPGANGALINKLTTTTATALNVDNTTISANKLEFRSISANGGGAGSRGITLNNTGASGGLTVTGTGSAGSGGSIQNKEVGIRLVGTRDASFDRISINNTTSSGIYGTQLTNFTLTNSTISNTGTSASAVLANSAVFLAEQAGGNETNVTGNVTITGNTLTNMYWHGVAVANFQGTLADINISNNTITSPTTVLTSKGTGIQLLTFAASSGARASITNATLNQNTVTNFPSDAGVMVQCQNAFAGSPASMCGSGGANDIAITNNVISGQSAANRIGTQGILANAVGSVGTVANNATFNINSNQVSHIVGNGISVNIMGAAIANVTTSSNTVNANNDNQSRGIAGGTGEAAAAFAPHPAVLHWKIEGNTVSNTHGSGIAALVGTDTGSGTLNVTLKNNNVTTAPGAANVQGIRVSHNGNVTAEPTICADIQDNQSVPVPDFLGIGLRKAGTVANVDVFGIEGLSPSPATAAQTKAFVESENPGGGGVLIASGSNFVNCSSAPNAALTSSSASPDPGAQQSNTLSADIQTVHPAYDAALEYKLDAPYQPRITNPAPARPATWSDMPVIVLPKDEEKKDEEEKDEPAAEQKAGEPQESDSAAPASPVNRTETYQPKQVEQPAQPGVRNISHVGPLGSAPSGATRFVPATYSAARTHSVTATRAASAKPAAKVSKARARTAPLAAAGETVNVVIGTMPTGKTVKIRFRVTVASPFTDPSEQVSNQGTVTDGGSINVLTDDLSEAGATDPTVTPIAAPPEIYARDARGSEPGELLFTIALSKPAAATVTVDYATANGTATAGADYTTTGGTATFLVGEQIKTVAVPILSNSPSNEPDETVLLNLSNASGGVISDNQATGTISEDEAPGQILISELRTSGPGGPGNDFVEIYNNSNSPVTVTVTDGSNGWGLFKMGADCNATPVLIGTIPKDTTILPGRGHYLFAAAPPQYTLKDYGGTDAALGDATLASDIESDRNVGLFSTTNVINLSSATRLDAVGFGTNAGNNCSLLREGSNLGPAGGSVLEHSYFRKLCDFIQGVGCQSPGTPKDTGDNSSDFAFADTQGTNVPGTGRRLGAPGPENMSSPRKTDLMTSLLLDSSAAAASPPNRVRNASAGDPSTSSFGTLAIRRRFVNNTGGPVTRLRFRVSEITGFPSASGFADLRAVSSMDVMNVSITNDSGTCNGPSSCTVNVKGTTLEQPPTQTIGGGLNATLTVTLGTPLAAGESVNVQFLLGVQNPGLFRFLVVAEALP